jgi:hypothetical protein
MSITDFSHGQTSDDNFTEPSLLGFIRQRLTFLLNIMTIALGINFGNYVLLAADTRTTFYNWAKQIIGYTDSSVKIQETSHGLITGAGRTDLLDAVKTRLEKEITNTDQIYEIIKEERLKSAKIPSITEDDIGLTGWIYSYRTILNDAPKLRLDAVHPSLGEGLARWEENKAAIICPYEAKKDEADEIAATVNGAIRPSTEFATIDESLQYHCQIVIKLIRQIQPKCPSVSRCCQMGIHILNGSMSISPIMKIDEFP